jgi:hypothetical protein
MEKSVFKDLLTQQINVLKAISYLVIGFMASYLILLYYIFNLTESFHYIILPYIFGVAANIFILPLHKKPYITYYSLIIMTFSEVMTFIILTGGMASPFMFVLIGLPAFAFYTSRKQGKIWFVISSLAVLVIFQGNSVGIHIKNIIPEQFQNWVLLFNILYVLVLNSTFSLLSKREAMKVHRSHSSLAVDLQGKSKRLENMVMLVNYSTELMCVIDMDNLTFDEVNPMFKLALGYELSELREKHVGILLKDESIPYLSAAKEDELVEFASSVLCLNGDIRIYSWLVVAKAGKLYASARDVT